MDASMDMVAMAMIMTLLALSSAQTIARLQMSLVVGARLLQLLGETGSIIAPMDASMATTTAFSLGAS